MNRELTCLSSQRALLFEKRLKLGQRLVGVTQRAQVADQQEPRRAVIGLHPEPDLKVFGGDLVRHFELGQVFLHLIAGKQEHQERSQGDHHQRHRERVEEPLIVAQVG